MYQIKEFNLENLNGLSADQIQVHLGLYAGYVKNTNELLERIETLKSEGGDSYVVAELQRRLGFEFNGMRMHEYYFEQLQGGAQDLNGKALDVITQQFGDVSAYLEDLKRVAAMRGIGWVVTYQDPRNQSLVNAWVSDHELGQLGGTTIVFALDMWEHAFMVDYLPATKGSYVDAYLSLVNWDLVSRRIQ
jgi:Fe-Mn family superoxide dismutase